LGEITAGQSNSAGVWLHTQSEDNSFLTKLSTPAGFSLAYPWAQLSHLKTISPQGQWLVATDPETQETVILEGAHLTPQARFPFSTSVAFSADEQWVALLYGQEIQLKQLPSLELAQTFPSPAGSPNGCVAFAPHQPWLAYYQPQGGAVIWDVFTREIVGQFTTSNPTNLCFVAFLPEQNELMTLEGDILRWRKLGKAEPGRELTLFTSPDYLVLSPNGRWLAVQAGEELFVLNLEQFLEE
jgi:hypothetical protein